MHRISFPYKQIYSDRPKSTPASIAQHCLTDFCITAQSGTMLPHQRLTQRINAPSSPFP
jgi:hypothetical protein